MINQCKSCGGFCKKSGCERANINPASSMTRTELIEDLRLNHEYCPKEVILLAANTIDALVAENELFWNALSLVATAENSALDLAYCKGIARAALGEKS